MNEIEILIGLAEQAPYAALLWFLFKREIGPVKRNVGRIMKRLGLEDDDDGAGAPRRENNEKTPIEPKPIG